MDYRIDKINGDFEIHKQIKFLNFYSYTPFKEYTKEDDLIIAIDNLSKTEKNPTFYFGETISFDLVSKIISGNKNLKTVIEGIN